MDETRTCPSWWPQLLWDLHFQPRPWPGPGPVNYPPIIEHIMANLHVHTLSYLIMDQGAASQIRAVAEEQLKTAVKNLSTSHEKAVGESSYEVTAGDGHPTVRSTEGPPAAPDMRASAEQALRDASAGLSKYLNSGIYATALPTEKSPVPPHYAGATKSGR